MSFTMSEHLIRYILETGFEYFRRNISYIDYVLRTHEEDTVKNLKTTLEYLDLPIIIGYPRDNMTIPLISIFLEGEQEKVEYIGDAIGDNSSVEFAINPVVVTDEVIESTATTFPYFELENRPINASYTLYKDDVALETSDYTLNIYTTRGKWAASCTDTSVYTADYIWYKNYQEELCAGINSVYRIEVISNNIEELLSLYRLVQYLLMASRSQLSYLGLKNQKLYGGDLEPLETTEQPVLLYSRAIYYEFTIEGSSVLPIGVLKQIQVSATYTID